MTFSSTSSSCLQNSRSGPTNIYIPPGPPLATKVVEAEVSRLD